MTQERYVLINIIMYIIIMKRLAFILSFLSPLVGFSQSYFNDLGQGSQSIGILYSPEQSLNIAKFLYSISINGRLDITPFVGYGSRGIGGSILNGGIAIDYFALKQHQGMPISMSIGAAFDYNYSTIAGISNTSTIGTIKGNLYHNLSVENFSLVPILGYQYQFFIDDLDANDSAVELAVALGLELSGGKLMYFKPSILFPMGSTQYFLNLGYMF